MSENNQEKKNFFSKPTPPNARGNYQIWLLVSLVMLIIGLTYFNKNNTTIEIAQKKFEKMVLAGEVKEVIIVNGQFVEVFLSPEAAAKTAIEPVQQSPFNINPAPQYRFKIITAESFKTDLEKLQKDIPEADRLSYRIDNGRADFMNWFSTWGFLIILFFGLYFLMRRMASGGAGGQIFNIGKSKAALFDADNKVKITFKDVAGLNEAKEEVEEIVDFLRNPTKYTALGGKIPKGALLVGPPGTGKTLLAKAVAGEAGVPFFSLSGSDFVEMFVGVGAARVRDLFRQAKEKAPCIVFIDEIDAIGRSRGKGAMPGSNDERENTLNSLLVEMDGFGTDSGVIIMAATNRPDVLDSALMRPGRFDRQISVDVPDILGREAIFNVHLQPLKLGEDVNVKKLAAQTPGFAGADLANICNEAALIAARHNKTQVEMKDFQDAIDRVIGGLEKKNKIISAEEKRIVAYHEAGHAIVGWFLEHTHPLVKVSIVPRGIAALGYAQYLPKEQFLYTTEQLFDDMCMTLGGRAAEDIIFNKISTGALSDLERITKMAYSMVTVYGMNEKIGHISFYDSKKSEYTFDKPYSDATAELIDKEVKILIDKAYFRTKELLKDKIAAVETIAQELLSKEVIFQDDIERLIGKRPYQHVSAAESYTEDEVTKPESDVKKSEIVLDKVL